MAKIRYSAQGLDDETTSRAMGRELPISPKKAMEVCRQIRGKRVEDAKAYLQRVIAMDERVTPGVYAEDLDAHSVPTLLEQAEERGLSTGVVTTTTVTHATPAACACTCPASSCQAPSRGSATRWICPWCGTRWSRQGSRCAAGAARPSPTSWAWPARAPPPAPPAWRPRPPPPPGAEVAAGQVQPLEGDQRRPEGSLGFDRFHFNKLEQVANLFLVQVGLEFLEDLARDGHVELRHLLQEITA